MKVITIGRGSQNDFIINDNFVGREHLQLVLEDGNVSLVDLNTKNGTFVNGKKVDEPVLLNQNDIVRIGNTTLPWRDYINSGSVTVTDTADKTPKKKKKREKNEGGKKPISWRNILSVVMTIFSLLFMIMMFIRMMK